MDTITFQQDVLMEQSLTANFMLFSMGLEWDMFLMETAYIYRSGFLQYAASNDLIILAPQMNWSLTNIFGTYDVNVPYRWQYTEPWLGVFTKKEDENIETNKGL